MQRTFHRPGMQQPRRGARAGQAPAENPNLLLQLLPILLLAFFSLLSYLPAMMGPKEPGYTWAPSGRFRDQHMTGGRGVAYYVDKKEWENNEYIKTSGVGPRSNGLRSFEAKVSGRKLLGVVEPVSSANLTFLPLSAFYVSSAPRWRTAGRTSYTNNAPASATTKSSASSAHEASLASERTVRRS